MDIISYINWVDAIGIILALVSSYRGARIGLTAELFKFIGMVLALVLAVHWYSQAAEIMITSFSMPAWLSQFICFLVIAQIVRLIFKYIIIWFLKVMNIMFVPQLERIGGTVIGLVRGILFYGLILLATGFIPLDYISESVYDKSYSGTFMVDAMERTYKSLIFWIPEDEREYSIFLIPPKRAKVEKI